MTGTLDFCGKHLLSPFSKINSKFNESVMFSDSHYNGIHVCQSNIFAFNRNDISWTNTTGSARQAIVSGLLPYTYYVIKVCIIMLRLVCNQSSRFDHLESKLFIALKQTFFFSVVSHSAS